MSESMVGISELTAALSKAQGEIESAKKDSINPHLKNKYADLASVWDACREALSKNGLAVIQTLFSAEGGVGVRTRLAHSSGQWIEGEVVIPVDKNTAQGMGSAITYGRRYSLAAIVGVTADDDDGNAASSSPPRSQSKPAPTPAANPALETAKDLAVKHLGFTPMSEAELLCVKINECQTMDDLEKVIPVIKEKKLINDPDVRKSYAAKEKELKQ